MADRATWVHSRLAEVDYDPAGVLEGGPALNFVRDVLAGSENSWLSYAIPDAQHDSVLAMLTLLHVPVRCVIESVDGDDDIAAEVNVFQCQVVLLLVTFGFLIMLMCVGLVVGGQRDLC